MGSDFCRSINLIDPTKNFPGLDEESLRLSASYGGYDFMLRRKMTSKDRKN